MENVDKHTAMSTDVKTILKLKVPVIVQIGGRRITMDEILTLAPGAILELEKGSDERLELLVNNKIVGEGSAVKVGENFGIRINDVGSTRERAEAMAS
ncbi:FliM/FliN family flagellar motor switch protein [Poriferisphaera sp. WC338]|uniref:FliM/FliN family flagellar motor switch protein n=1 Tax=Poriferisphaera sp. WC338 TaxID=3425129 RepID=UPI003D81868A